MIVVTAAALAGDKATVLAPVANMHSKPSLDSDVVSQAIYAMDVAVAEEREGWTRIRTPDDYPGWVESRLLRKRPESAPGYASGGQTATVESLYAHLYREASVTRHAPLLTVPFETRLEVILEKPEENGRWLAVRLPDGRQAWVQRGDLSFDPPPRSIPQVIGLARRFLGLPYTWGGTSSFGYDCSGFTQMLCRRGGRAIPRDAAPQAGWDGMRPVERADLAPGDLLYFGPRPEKSTHTGMYIGGGEFIHATVNTRPVVQISRLDDQPWTRLFTAARRWQK
jgi:cell wall-associated NlpC family hydrolase